MDLNLHLKSLVLLLFRTICFLYLFLISSYAFSQGSIDNIKFDRISSENIKLEKGLSQNSVRAIMQDSKKYMWFGTWDGLNRFDGYNFVIYKPNASQPENSLSNETTNALFEDKEGLIWIGTEKGINKFDRKTQKFTQYRKTSKAIYSISSDTVWCITEDQKGFLWIGTQSGLNRFDKKTGRFDVFLNIPQNSNSIANNTIQSLCVDNEGFLWIGTMGGLDRFDLANWKIKHFNTKTGINHISSDTIYSIFKSSDGNLWLGTNKGLNFLNLNNGKFTAYINNAKDKWSISSNFVSAVFEDKKGRIWAGTIGGGLNLLEKNSTKFINFINQTNDESSLSNNDISSIYEDVNGVIWVGTSRGVNKIDLNAAKFMHYFHYSDDQNSLSNNMVWGIYADSKNQIWIATDDGINVFNPKTKKFSFIRNIKNNTNSLVSNVTRAVYEDSEGNYWFGTANSGLDRFDSKTKEFTHYKNENGKSSSVNYNAITCFLEDKFHNLWIGTWGGGLNKYNFKTKKFKHYTENILNPKSLRSNIIWNLYTDKSGLLWVSTDNGLAIYNRKSDNFTVFLQNSKYNVSLSSDRFFSVFEDSKGFIWAATIGGGLNKINRRTGQIKVYTEKEGLSNNIVYNIFEDKNGNLWMSTNFGLSQFNPTTETFVNFDVKDGIQSHEFNSGAAAITKDGQMYFGGMNGFNSFFPQEVKQNENKPPIVITTFKIFNKDQFQEIYDGDTIELSYNDNFFSFEFSSLDYSNPSKNRFAYRLNNFDPDWIYVDANKRFAEYTKVSPGIYTFQVKGTNNDGVWNEKGTTVVIIITPPWYNTWAFRICFGSFIILLIYNIIRIRFKRIKSKHEVDMKMLNIEKQVFELEQKSLRLQMNPHFIFNSLNSIQSFIISSNTDKAILYLAKFAQLMRLILSNTRESYITIKDELKALSYYMDIERLRFDNKFDFEIIIDKEIDDDFVGIPPMIIQPYIENAILHGMNYKEGKGKLTITLKLKEDTLLCIIEDDGVGRQKAMEIKEQSGLKHKSRGMEITKERLEILNRQHKGQTSVRITDLKDNNGFASGTKVELVIPFIDL